MSLCDHGILTSMCVVCASAPPKVQGQEAATPHPAQLAEALRELEANFNRLVYVVEALLARGAGKATLPMKECVEEINGRGLSFTESIDDQLGLVVRVELVDVEQEEAADERVDGAGVRKSLGEADASVGGDRGDGVSTGGSS